MVTKLTPNWEFNDCVGYIVDGFSGGYDSIAKVYVASLMSQITKSNGSSKHRESIHSPNQIFINSSDSRPNSNNYVVCQNYIEVPVDNDIILKEGNKALYEKYLASLPKPQPMYYIPFNVSLPAGSKVSVTSANKDLTDLKIHV